MIVVSGEVGAGQAAESFFAIISLMSIKTIKRSSIFQPLYERAVARRAPQAVMFELTYRCNLRCPHCYVKGSPKKIRELTTKQVFSILDQLRDLGTFNVAFTGGEALLRRDIFNILAHAKRCGFETTLFSNGYLIDKTAARKLAQVNVNNVDITLNSLKPEIFERLTGAKGALRKVKNAIDLLIKHGISVKIKSTGMTINRGELADIGKYARSLNIIYNLGTEILPCRNGCASAVDSYSLNPSETQAIRRMVYPEIFRGKRKKTRSRRRRDRIFNCGVGRTLFSITPDGKMNFCIEIDSPRYDMLSQGAADCWEKLKAKVDKLNQMPDFVCKKCDLIKYCGWCPGRSYLETGTFNRCSEYFRKSAISIRKGGA